MSYNQPFKKRPLHDFSECSTLGVPEKCAISTDVHGNIESLGPWQRGTFEPRADIAGPGFLWAAALTSIFLLIGGFIAMITVVMKWRKVKGTLEMHYPPADERQGMGKILYKAFRTYLLATLDTQMLFMFAYGLNFWLVQKCTISAYHYAIGIEIGLISCANSILTIAFVSEYWKAPFTGMLRLVAMVPIFAFLGYELNQQRTRVENPEYIPSFSRNDSTVLLPASCFLDSQFKDIYSNLSTSVREKIGYTMKPHHFWEFALWIGTVIGLFAGILRGLMQLWTDRGRKAKTYYFWTGLVICLYKFAALMLFAIVNWVAWLRIWDLKTWVGRSGWIKPGRVTNPEDDWLGNGQILPMLQLVMIVVFIFNEYELEFYSPTLKTPSPQSSIQLSEIWGRSIHSPEHSKAL